MDGVPHTLLKNYIGKGILPNLGSILNNGFALSQMDASLPDVSSTSWASFITGANPGEHGIYGFMDLKPGSYQMCFPDSRSIKAPALWEILGKTAGDKKSSISQAYNGKLHTPRRSVVLNVPQTNPAVPMNGVLVAGFVALDLEKAVYPGSAFQYLSSMGYSIDVDSELAKDQKEIFLKELLDSFDKRKRAFRHFFQNEDWDLFIAAITETDRLHHFFYDAALDENHPFHETFVDFYRDLDRFLGEFYEVFLEKAGKDGLFIVISDHGFTKIKSEVYVNAFLQKEGFLKLRREGRFFERIEEGTRVFALDPCRIYLNMEGRFPRGFVTEAKRDSVMEEITGALFALRDEGGEKVISNVFRGNEIYHGVEKDRGPDLLFLPNDGFDLKGILKEEKIFGKRHFTGMHTRHDAHCVLPADVLLNGKKPRIEDMAKVILDYFVSD